MASRYGVGQGGAGKNNVFLANILWEKAIFIMKYSLPPCMGLKTKGNIQNTLSAVLRGHGATTTFTSCKWYASLYSIGFPPFCQVETGSCQSYWLRIT